MDGGGGGGGGGGRVATRQLAGESNKASKILSFAKKNVAGRGGKATLFFQDKQEQWLHVVGGNSVRIHGVSLPEHKRRKKSKGRKDSRKAPDAAVVKWE